MHAAVYCGTRKVYEQMWISAKSLIIHSSVQEIYFLIEDDIFPYPLSKKIKIINVSNQPYFHSTGPNYNCGWTYMILLRAAFTKFFPHLNQILSLDVDTLVCEDISNLWHLPLKNYYLAGVREPGHIPKHIPYINFGVVVFNLQRIRQFGKDNEMIYKLNTEHYACPEQDCLNEICKNEILVLDPAYNVCGWTEDTGRCKIKHYAGIDGWEEGELAQHYAKLKIT